MLELLAASDRVIVSCPTRCRKLGFWATEGDCVMCMCFDKTFRYVIQRGTGFCGWGPGKAGYVYGCLELIGLHPRPPFLTWHKDGFL